MSRYIQGTSHIDKDDELYQKSQRSNKILILRNSGILYCFLIRENRICKAVREEYDPFPIGTVLIGKAVNVVKQIGGAFFGLENIKGAGGTTGYLPLKENTPVIPLNRKPDGRILAEDEIVVQVAKEALKTKPLQLTTEISLAGQFVVIKRGSGNVGYSAKCGEEEKSRLQEAFREWEGKLQDIDIIFRTNAQYVENELWEEELIDLISQFHKIDCSGQMRTAYSVLWKPEPFYLNFLKDIPLPDLDEVVTDEPELYEELKKHPYAKRIPVRLYADNQISLQSVYSLNTRIRELLSSKVYMKSGAYLMIEPTEALISVDVNTGKAQKKAEPEEFYFQINMEAVKEVCYQLSARNLSGMVLIDFINMKDREHIKKLLSALKEETAKDSVTTCFVDFTKLGLAELTRKKTMRTLSYTMRGWKEQ